MDKYKQKIIERDHQIDKALGYLISNKMIENPYKIENVSKSPFRKINLCNPWASLITSRLNDCLVVFIP